MIARAIRPHASVPAWLVLSVVPFLLLSFAHWQYGPLLVSSDYAQYLLHAKALVEGRSYGDTGYLYTPLAPFIGPALQPPGLPLTIAPVLWAVGASDGALRLVMIVSGMAFLMLATVALARTDGWPRAACAAALTGIAIERAFATNVPMSDLGFCALVWAVVAVADREGPWSVRRALVVSGLIAAALSYRIAGAPLLPALFVYGVLRRKAAGPIPLITAGVWAGLGVITLAVTPLGAAAIGFAADARWISWLGVRFALETYSIASVQPLLYPFPSSLGNLIYHMAAVPLVMYGCWRWARENADRFVFIVTGAYGLFLIVAPAFQARYLWPLFPIIAIGFIRGLTAAWRLVRPQLGEVALDMRVRLLLAGVAIATLVLSIRAPGPRTIDHASDVLDVYAELAKLRAADTTVRASLVNPRVLTWRVGIPAMAIPVNATEDQFYAELVRQRITHVVEGDPGYARREMRLFRSTRERFPNAFVPVYRNAQYAVYRFNPEPADSTTAATHRVRTGATAHSGGEPVQPLPGPVVMTAVMSSGDAADCDPPWRVHNVRSETRHACPPR